MAAQRVAAPITEFYLQGSIQDQHHDTLVTRLNGICDPSGTAQPFKDLETVYSLKVMPYFD